MLNSVDFSGKPFHFIGIGGIGMSALAYVLTQRQLPVSGSDLRLSHITRRLQEAGAHVFWRQEPENLKFFNRSPQLNYFRDALTRPSATVAIAELPQVICSTAIGENNAEYLAAHQMGCPIFHRSDVLAGLMGQYSTSIAVAGTHGKTTTSSMMGYALLQAGLDPTMVVGGEVSAWEGNARVGNSDWFVAEADESDGSLVKFAPTVGVITNIELDHPDHYSRLEDVVDIFRQFSQQCRVVVASADCDTIRTSLQADVTYSLEPERAADFSVRDVTYTATETRATVWERGNCLGWLCLSVVGRHNLSNALAVIAAGRYLNVPFHQLAAGLSTFEGARRRFERRGFYGGIQFVDDYAHHPNEIRVTLAAAKLQKQAATPLSILASRVVAVFQPHRYSRAATFLEEFARAFEDADEVVVTDIYSAGEENLTDISGEALAEAIALHHPHVRYCPTLELVEADLIARLRPGDMALFLGAGNLNRVIPSVMEPFQSAEAATVQRA